MKYITLSDMAGVIRNNIYKIPHDVDLVVGIPRSGMISASIISEYLNRPLVDIDNFCNGCIDGVGGGRLVYVRNRPIKKILVVDDTVCGGGSMRSAKQKLKNFNDGFEFLYMAVYAEGVGLTDVDFYLEDVRGFTHNGTALVLYEWNVFHHHTQFMAYCIYDLDGVMCIDPPSDYYDVIVYEKYIETAIPKFTPTVTVGAICTYRIEKYRDATQRWLEKNEIKCNELVMFPSQSREERTNSGMSPAQFKADYYKNKAPWMILFVESSDDEARQIYELTKKPVLSVERNVMYGSE